MESKSTVKRKRIMKGFDPLRSTNMILENTEDWMTCHEESVCRGDYCTLHNRSDHPMRSWMQHWRGDTGLMERICEHGVGHPDPDDFNLRAGFVSGEHGCDMCCRGYYHKGDK